MKTIFQSSEKTRRAATARFFVTALAVTLAACGGGGGTDGDPTVTRAISGTAAAGAALIGSVTIKDSLGAVKTVAIGAGGAYTIDVSDMSPPFLVRAQGTAGGRSYSLHSAATAADINGNINITPLTDLIVANVAGQVAAAVYDGGNFGGMSADALNQAEGALQQRLQPVLTALGLDPAIDLLRAVFNANHTGLDAALDVLRVSVDPLTLQATIGTLLNDQKIIDDLASQTDTGTVDATGVTGATATDMQQIVALFDAWGALFANSVPSPTDAALLALFDEASFKFGGDDLATFLSGLTSGSEPVLGVTFSDIAFDALTATTADLRVTARFPLAPTWGGANILFKASKLGSAWKLVGDLRIANVEVDTFATRTDAGAVDTGLKLDLEDNGGAGIDYAVVTGKGLPTTTGGTDGASAGALLVRSGDEFVLAQSNTSTGGSNRISLPDITIAGLSDGEIYTVTLYDDNQTPADFDDDTVLATYTELPGKRPYLRSELSAAPFPVITTTAAEIGDLARKGGNLTVTWTQPAGAVVGEVSFFRIGGGSSDEIDASVAATASRVTLTLDAPAFAVGYSRLTLEAVDAFGRELSTYRSGQ